MIPRSDDGARTALAQMFTDLAHGNTGAIAAVLQGLGVPGSTTLAGRAALTLRSPEMRAVVPRTVSWGRRG